MPRALFDEVEVPGPLAHYRCISPKSGLRISPLWLGAMSFGDAWVDFLGKCPKDEAFKMMDTFYKAGGTSIDTSVNYQDGESEQWIGEWMEKRKNRDQMVIATKFTTLLDNRNLPAETIRIHFGGNSLKTLRRNVANSLKALRTDYIDLLYIHWDDRSWHIEEMAHALHALVMKGTVLHLGVSDMPAWKVAAFNTYAQAHALTPFVVYQGRWNLAQRDLEVEILPMVKHFQMGIAPWDTLGGGAFKEGGSSRGKLINSDHLISPGDKLRAVAAKIGLSWSQLALAYIIKKYPYAAPIVGGRSAEHLSQNIEGLSKLHLVTPEVIKELEEIAPPTLTFPADFLGYEGYPWLLKTAGHMVDPTQV